MLALGSSDSIRAADVSSDHPRYTLTGWGVEDGLPQDSVLAITQTRDGYLWVGTFNGLARFDGVRFKVFSIGNTPEFLSDNVRALLEDQAGDLWIGTTGGGLLRRSHGQFRRYGPIDGLRSPSVNALFEDSRRILWVGTDHGLYQRAGDRFLKVQSDHSMLEDRVMALWPEPTGELWVGTRSGICLLRDGVPTGREIPSSTPLRNAWRDEEGGTWFAYERGIAARRLLEGPEAAWKSMRIAPTAVARCRSGGWWIGTSNGQLCHLSTSELGDPSETPHLRGKSVEAIYEDQQGNIWVGSDGGGLQRLREKRVTVLSSSNGLLTPAVSSLAQDGQKRIWAGTFGKGLHLWTGEDFRRSPTEPPIVNVTSVLSARDGVTWFGTYDEGIFRSEGGRAFQPVRELPRGCRTLFQDRDGGIWVGTVDSGVDYFHGGQLKHYTTSEGLSDNHVSSIAQDTHGNIWVGTLNGLNKINQTGIQIFGRAEGLKGPAVRALYLDSQARLWMGSTSGGLTFCDNGRFRALTVDEGLVSDWVEQIVEDGDGNLWLGSNRGLMRVDRAELDEWIAGNRKRIHCTVLSREEGLPETTCGTGFQPSCLRTCSGQLWFCTGLGIVVVEPQNVQPDTKPPAVYIEELRADGNTIAGRHSDAIELPAGTARLEFQYTGLDLAAPAKMNFCYRLEGLEHEWVQAGHDRRASYTHLPPGHYRFQVIAVNNARTWNLAGDSVRLILRPFFWQRPVFQLAVGLALVGCTAVLVRAVGRKRHQQRMQALKRRHALELERSRIARDMHDGLGASVVKMAMLGEDIEHTPGLPEAARSRLRKLGAGARQLLRDMEEVVWSINPKNDSLEGLAGYIAHFAREHFSDTGVECHLEMPAELPAWVVTSDVRHHLLLAMKEALNNILKHAGAADTWIKLELENTELRLQIRDNGRGGTAATRTGGGNGRANMSEHVRLVGGRFEVQCPPGQGTLLTMIVPLRRPSCSQ